MRLPQRVRSTYFFVMVMVVFGVTTQLAADPPPSSGGPGGPAIGFFTGVVVDNVVHLNGSVLDDKSVSGLTVRFGGLLTGQSTTTTENGTFEYIFTRQPGQTGFINVFAIDSDGNRSDLAWWTLQQ